MKVAELVDAAAEKAGTAKKLAEMMGKRPTRLSEWKAGSQVPDSAEIAFMAKVAGLPVLITIALISKEIYPDRAWLWDEALGEAKAPTYWSRLGADCILC